MKQKLTGKRRLALSFLGTLLCYSLCNGYRFFHQAFAGDALLMVYQNDEAWQIALGRFFQPILILLRGGLETPLLISALAIFWLSLSVYYFCEVFSLDNALHILCIAALFSCNIALIVANASFLPWVDFYALALFLSVFSVWLWNRSGKLYFIIGILCLALSLGIYQSYVCVALGMLILLCLTELFRNTELKEFFRKAVLLAIGLAASFLLYFAVWKLFQRVFHIWTSDSYNGLSSVGDYSGQSIPALFFSTYRHVWEYLWNPEVYVTMTFRNISLSLFLLWGLRIFNICILVLLLITVFRLMRGIRRPQCILAILLVLLFPFGINFVCFLSKDMEHSLMIFAFCLIYAAYPVLHKALPAGAPEDKVPTVKRIIFTALPALAIFAAVWTDIVFANQLHLKRELQEEAAHSLMTRIVYEIEHTPGYEAGVTPVAFSGSFETTPFTDHPDIFSDLSVWGVGRTPMTYIGTDYAYLEYVMNVHMNLTRIDAAEVKDLPLYPAAGSVAFVGDTLVVKISEF